MADTQTANLGLYQIGSSSDNVGVHMITHYNSNMSILDTFIAAHSVDSVTITDGILTITAPDGTTFTASIDNALAGIVAAVFDDTATYNEGDPVIYEGAFYVFTTTHTGAWDAGDVSQTTLAALIDSLSDASNIVYDNSGSGLIATDVQAAIDEIANSRGNSNLLINPWFTVNQRGFTSGSATLNVYGVDRWNFYSYAVDGTAQITSKGMKLTPVSSEYFCSIRQAEASYSHLNGRTVTFSVKYSTDDITFSIVHGTVSNFDASTSEMDIIPFSQTNNTLRVRYIHTSTRDLFSIDVKTATTIRVAKLEIGSISTLELDTEPNYSIELIKCRRYYYRLEYSIYAPAAIGVARTATEARFILPLAIPMRTTPTLTTGGSFYIEDKTTNFLVNSVSLTFSTAETIQISVTTSSNMTPGDAVRFYNEGTTYLAFNAEL